jgi:hypothetical protein
MSTRTIRTGALLGMIVLSALPAAAQTSLRARHDMLIGAARTLSPAGPARPDAVSTAGSALTVLAFQGEVLEDGGTLNPLAFTNPATINGSATIAFFSLVDGVERNQGIFVADGSGVRTIVRGCGAGGGTDDPATACGDPAPAGGTFSGLYAGTFFAPVINDAGDVLFFADVFRRRHTTRGLFLYRAADQRIVKVAKAGDRSPLGGRLGAVGPGSLSNNGTVAFLAQTKPEPWPSASTGILLWRAGRLSKWAAVGDPAPGGGTFSALGTETITLSSGATVPVGPVPGINNHGQISFRANVTGGVTEQGLIVSTNGVHQWYVRAGDVTPAGGVYVDFSAPILNSAGDIAFVANYAPPVGDISSAWFAGSPRSGWRKVLALLDPVDGGQCVGLAISRNPMHPLDDNGDLMVWSNVQTPGGQLLEKLFVGAPDGTLSTAATEGDATPLGGQIETIQPWASLRGGRGTVSATTPGALASVINAHMVSGGTMSGAAEAVRPVITAESFGEREPGERSVAPGDAQPDARVASKRPMTSATRPIPKRATPAVAPSAAQDPAVGRAGGRHDARLSALAAASPLNRLARSSARRRS